MRGNTPRKLGAVCATAAVALSVALAGGTSDAAPAIKASRGVNLKTKTITIANLACLSGPAAALGQLVYDGNVAGLDAINAAGGVDGFKLSMNTQDAAYTPSTAVTDFANIAHSAATTINFGSPTLSAFLGTAVADNMPVVTISWDSAWDTHKNLVPLGTPYAYDIANGLDYLTKVNSSTKGDTKIGMIYQNDSYGLDGVRGYDAAVANDALTKAALAPFTLGTTDHTAQVQTMKSAGAQIVVVTALPGDTIAIESEAAALNYHPTFLLQAPSFFGAVAKAYAEPDTYATSFAPPFTSNAPGSAAMRAAEKKYVPSARVTADKDVWFEFGYEQMQLIKAILNKAITDKDLSPAGIINARDHLGKFNAQGLAPNLNYTPTLGVPSTHTIINKLDLSAPGGLDAVATNYIGTSYKRLLSQYH